MKFQIRDLKNLLCSIKNSKIDRIHIKSNRFELLINKKHIDLYFNSRIVNIKNYSNTSLSTKKLKKENKKQVKYRKNHNNSIHAEGSTTYSTILSPMVGTFYRSPAPNEPSFVKTNDTIEKRQTVCIIEAMKLMNEIEAEVSGKIVDILVKDGEIVDCGQALMRVQT
uniref:Biotin carboxyl carrier protein of acetyl-CoA carboxylase n=1 Tax=Melanthalia intermedia TaxID=172989 RepID=A0A345UAU0_9FLOR|nr:acetyl-CoA carboxylase, biotin carboxyl carrier protein [Melanthalia intermedia]AXI97576.1 acetyl-CoA carboxylase, biotin carboxyl carrier protein [Melanthalia intermedia]